MPVAGTAQLQPRRHPSRKALVVGLRAAKNQLQDLAPTAKGLGAVLVLFIAICLIGSAGEAEAAVFTQEAVGHSPDGTPVPVTVIDPESMSDLASRVYDLGSGRRLEILTNLAPMRGEEIDSLAAVVQRCYGYLEAASDRAVPGGVLLYLLEFPQRPRYYRFQAEVDDNSEWNEVRVALLNAGQPLLGRGASTHVTEFIYDTLPHELTHSLLTFVPTVRHDLDGQRPQGTRWFIEGVCEKLAKGFALSESPNFWKSALAARHLDRIHQRPELRSLVMNWGQSSDFSWADESDLYGLSMLLVNAWLEYIELGELLALMTQRGGDHDGPALMELLAETAQVDDTYLLARARVLGLAMSLPEDLSLLQTQGGD